MAESLNLSLTRSGSNSKTAFVFRPHPEYGSLMYFGNGASVSVSLPIGNYFWVAYAINNNTGQIEESSVIDVSGVELLSFDKSNLPSKTILSIEIMSSGGTPGGGLSAGDDAVAFLRINDSNASDPILLGSTTFTDDFDIQWEIQYTLPTTDYTPESIFGDAAYDYFGTSVDVSADGSVVAIGAPGNDTNADNAGQVKVYTLSGSTWVQRGNDIDGTEIGSLFGHSVSISGDGSLVAIGAPFDSSLGINQGSVSIYEWNGSSWVLKGSKLYGSAAYDTAGYSVSISGDGSKVAIGSPDSNSDYGSVSVYEWSGSDWSQIGADIDGDVQFAKFGHSIKMSEDGTTFIAGGPFSGTAGTQSGHACVYEYDASWSKVGSTIYGDSPYDQLGYSVSMSSDGTKIAVGIPRQESSGVYDVGEVVAYELVTGEWSQIGDSMIGVSPKDLSGTSVSMSGDGNMITIGATSNVSVIDDLISPTILGSGIYYYSPTNLLNVPKDLPVRAVKFYLDGSLILGGAWRGYDNPYAFNDWNNQSVPAFVKLKRDGSIDSAFMANVGTGISLSTYASYPRIEQIEVGNDGKIIIAGAFDNWNGVTVDDLVVLNSDGTLDSNFVSNIGLGINNTIYAIQPQSDGKIIVAGSFSSFGGSTVGKIVRLNSDGTLDSSFMSNIGSGFAGNVYGVRLLSDGKIVCSISRNTTFNGTPVSSVACLNPDGTLNTAFTSNVGTGIDNSVASSLAVSSSDKIALKGYFNSWNGTPTPRLVVLNSDGTRDTSFSISTLVDLISHDYKNCIEFVESDKLLITCKLTYDGNTSGVIVLNSDGTVDTSYSMPEFLPNTFYIGYTQNGGPTGFALNRESGEIVIFGRFYSFNGESAYGVSLMDFGNKLNNNNPYSPRGAVSEVAETIDGRLILAGNFPKGIEKITLDGIVDSSFSSNIGSGPNGTIEDLKVQSDGKIILCGRFTQWDGVSVGGILRLNADGTVDATFKANSGTGFAYVNPVYTTRYPYHLNILTDGSIIVSGHDMISFNGVSIPNIIKLDSDGSLDTSFSATQYTSTRMVTKTIEREDGKLYAICPTYSIEVALLNVDGSNVSSFSDNYNADVENGDVSTAILLPSGKLVVASGYSDFEYRENGSIRTSDSIVINDDGSLDLSNSLILGNSLAGYGSTVAVAPLPSGKFLLGKAGGKCISINSDFTEDETFRSSVGDFNGRIMSVATDDEGTAFIGGDFISAGDHSIPRKFFTTVRPSGISTGLIKVFSLDGSSWGIVDSPIYGQSAGDKFGNSTSLSSDKSVVVNGAVMSDDGGSDSGSVYIYNLEEGFPFFFLPNTSPFTFSAIDRPFIQTFSNQLTTSKTFEANSYNKFTFAFIFKFIERHDENYNYSVFKYINVDGDGIDVSVNHTAESFSLISSISDGTNSAYTEFDLSSLPNRWIFHVVRYSPVDGFNTYTDTQALSATGDSSFDFTSPLNKTLYGEALSDRTYSHTSIASINFFSRYLTNDDISILRSELMG